MPQNEPLWMTAAEACAHLGINITKLQNLYRSGRIARRLNPEPGVLRREANEYDVNSCTIPPARPQFIADMRIESRQPIEVAPPSLGPVERIMKSLDALGTPSEIKAAILNLAMADYNSDPTIFIECAQRLIVVYAEAGIAKGELIPYHLPSRSHL